MKDCSAFQDMRRYKNWAHKICSWEYLTLWRPVLPVSQSTECLVSALHPQFFQGVVGGQQLQQHMICFDPCTSRWQVLMTSANLWSTEAWIRTAPKSWLIPLLLIPPQKEQPVQNHLLRCAADSFRGSSDLPKDAFLYPLGQQHPEKCLLLVFVAAWAFLPYSFSEQGVIL